MTTGLLPTGFRDRLPPEADASARLVRAVLDTVALHGYERVQTLLAEWVSDLVFERVEKLGGGSSSVLSWRRVLVALIAFLVL